MSILDEYLQNLQEYFPTDFTASVAGGMVGQKIGGNIIKKRCMKQFPNDPKKRQECENKVARNMAGLQRSKGKK